jgi:hypothetical protein
VGSALLAVAVAVRIASCECGGGVLLGWVDRSRIEAQCEGTRDDDSTAC